MLDSPPPSLPSPVRLSTRLKLALLLWCATLGALATLFIVERQVRVVDEFLTQHGKTLATSIAALTGADVAVNNRAALSPRLEAFSAMPDIRSITITDRQGSPLATVQRNAAGNLNAVAGNTLHPTQPLRPTPSQQDATPHGSRIVWAAIGQLAPIGWVRLEYSTAPIDTARSALRRVTVLGVGAAIAGSALALYLAFATRTGARCGIFRYRCRRTRSAPPDRDSTK